MLFYSVETTNPPGNSKRGLEVGPRELTREPRLVSDCLREAGWPHSIVEARARRVSAQRHAVSAGRASALCGAPG